MLYTSVLQFAADHPWIAFFLSWPTMAFIISLSWLVASVFDNVYRATLGLIAICVNAFTVICRGHPAARANSLEELFGALRDKPSEDEGDEKESR